MTSQMMQQESVRVDICYLMNKNEVFVCKKCFCAFDKFLEKKKYYFPLSYGSNYILLL